MEQILTKIVKKIIENFTSELLETIQDIELKIMADARMESFQAGLELQQDALYILDDCEKFAEGRMSMDVFVKKVQDWKTRQETKTNTNELITKLIRDKIITAQDAKTGCYLVSHKHLKDVSF